ncbi:MAG: hypothetical protein KA807_18330 [Prolixibacteraceae bacterium]|nr:hypothetical protein [Prolixibacteraceae bacterium]
MKKYIVIIFSVIIFIILTCLFLFHNKQEKELFLYETESFKRQDTIIDAMYSNLERSAIYNVKFVNVDYSKRITIDEIVEEVKNIYPIMDSSTSYFSLRFHIYNKKNVLSSKYLTYTFYKDSIFTYDLKIFLPKIFDSLIISNYKIDSLYFMESYGYNKDSLFSFVRKQRDYKIVQLKYDMYSRIKDFEQNEYRREQMKHDPFYRVRDSLKAVLKR